ncbi:hypothetical protein RZS08_14590, partial [Arthrospira platensis SPKY1]|nr:hypothetical protein [Arthrospira platensis SPKY1]
MISSLLNGFETRHAGLTIAQKRSALTHVIEASNGNADRLYTRLQALVSRWDAQPGDAPIETGSNESESSAPSTRSPAPVSVGADSNTSIAEFLSVIIKRAIVPVLIDNAPLRAEAEAIAEAIATHGDRGHDGEALRTRLGRLSERIEWIEDDRRAIREALLKLLKQ